MYVPAHTHTKTQARSSTCRRHTAQRHQFTAICVKAFAVLQLKHRKACERVYVCVYVCVYVYELQWRQKRAQEMKDGGAL